MARLRSALYAAVCLTTSIVVAPALAQDAPVTLRLAHWLPPAHPLYPALHHQHALLAMSPLLDQQLAGFVAKFGCYVPMWIVFRFGVLK